MLGSGDYPHLMRSRSDDSIHISSQFMSCFEKVNPKKIKSKVFMTFGKKDTLVPIDLDFFNAIGCDYFVDNVEHQITQKQLDAVLNWLKKTIKKYD